MRYKLYFQLENEQFPLQYRKSILSFFKKSLSEYSKEYYEKLYHAKDNTIKPFTFSVFFSSPKFEKDKIYLGRKEIELNISIEDCSLAIILYNSFNHQRNQIFPLENNSMKLKDITMIPEKAINEESIKIQFMSPLVVRQRNQDTKRDYYYSYIADEFESTLKINMKEQLKISNLSEEVIDSFKITPIAPKKTVVSFYEKQIECSLGIYELTGDKSLLEYLYKSGMGSKRSSGFGMFTILD